MKLHIFFLLIALAVATYMWTSAAYAGQLDNGAAIPAPPLPETPGASVTVYANIYKRDMDGKLTGNVTSLKVMVYRKADSGDGYVEFSEIDDNTELVMLDRKAEDAEHFVNVRLPGGEEVLVHEKNIRPDRYDYDPCPPCSGKGSLKCPACSNGKILRASRKFTCRICSGKGRVTCRHCQGLGKRRAGQ